MNFVFTQTGGYCGSDILLKKEIEKNNAINAKFEKFNLEWESYAIKNRSSKRGTTVVLPVIFHLMTTNSYKESSVLNSEAALNKIVTMLNEVYSGKIVGNKSAGVNTNIQFCLAKVDAFGQKISSYKYDCPALDNHREMKLEESGLASSVIINTKKFPTNKYINIYVVENIEGAVAGFATLPSSHGEPNDGIYIEASFLIDNNAKNSTVLSHEMGHYLGLLHTFGRCSESSELTLKACACDNSNCLVDGDMVCDTPPDFSIKPPTNGCSNPPNTCNTDTLSTVTDPNAPSPTKDINDLVNNYMDYGNWDCQYTFTQGQINRMHYSIDPTVGARNSLLNSSVCNVACEELCKLSIRSPSVKINGLDVANTLQLTSTPITFDFKINSCPQQYNQLLWKVIDLSTNKEISSSTSGNIVFKNVGNFRILLEAKNTSTTCVQSQSIDIQVLPASTCLPNCDLKNGWGTEWKRVEIDGGWQRNTSNNFIFSNAVQREINKDQTTTRTAIVTSLESDPNFKNIKNPQDITKIFRVGDIINDKTERIHGAATYVTYTFTPTPSNSKFRVYYIGMKHNSTAGGKINFQNFTTGDNNGTQSAFGYISHYKIEKSDGQTLLLQPIYNQIHEGYNNLNDSPFETEYGFINSPSLKDYNIMPDWKYTDLDFSEYSCGNTTVTVTFYALTDTGKSPGHLQSYGYFAIGNCSAGIPKEIELTNKNYYMGCGSCINLEIPPAYDYYGYYQDKVFDVSVQESTNNESWNNNICNINGFSKLYLNLCKTPDENKFKYFKITYKKVCGNEKTATVVIEQGFVHTPKPPCDNSGTLLKIEDKYFQYCGDKDKSTLPDLNLNDPCWVTDKKQVKYKWQYTSSSQSDITSARWYDIRVWDKVEETSKLITTKDFKPSSPDIYFFDCGTYVRRIAFYEDPYCPGIPIQVPSDIVHYTDLSLAFRGNIKNDDVCGNIQTNVKITGINFPNCFSHDLEINDKMRTGNVTFTAKINGKEIGKPIIKDVTNQNNFASIDFPFFDKNILKNGGNEIVIDYNYINVLGCESKGTILGSIHRNPSAVAGTISLVKNTCTQTVFEGTNDNNDEFKNPWGYVWEYSYDNFTNDIQTFPNSNSSGFTLPDIKFPVSIRRKAIGPKTNCVIPAYTEVQYIDKKASKDNFLVSVEKFCPGKDAKLTISNSNFSTPFTIKAVGDQTNIKQEVHNNLPITLNLTNITTNTNISITLSDLNCSETQLIDLIPAKAAKIEITSNLKTPVFDEKNNLYTLNFCFSDDLKNNKITASPSFSQYNWTSSGNNVGTLNNISGTKEALYNLKVSDTEGCSNETNVKVTNSPEIKGELNSYFCDNTKYLSVDNLTDNTLYNYEWSYSKLLGSSPIKIGSNNYMIKDNLIESTTVLPIKYYVKLTDKNGCSKNLGPVLIKKRDILITNVKSCIDGDLNLAISPINFSIKITDSITATLNPNVYKSSTLNNLFNIKINSAKNKTYAIKYKNNECEVNKTYLPTYFEQPKIQFTATIDGLGVDIDDQPYPYEDRVSTVTGCGRNASITAIGSGNFPLKYKLFGILPKNYFLFNWKSGDQSFLSETTPNIYSTIVKIQPSSEKVFTVSMTDANNCSVTKKIKHISVDPPVLSVTYDPIVCSKEDKLLKLTPYLSNYDVQVIPNNPFSKVKKIVDKSEYLLTAGSYQVKVTGKYKCQNRSYPVEIKNNGPIKINNLDLYYLENASLILNADYMDINNKQSATRVIWTSEMLSKPVDGVYITITKVGYYTLTVTDKCGVVATKKIQVVKRPAITITKSNREESFEINPNPNKGVFYLTFENEVKLLNVYVYDVQGKLLYIPDMIDKSGGVNQKLDLSNQNISSGLYFVHVQTENNYLIKNLIIE